MGAPIVHPGFQLHMPRPAWARSGGSCTAAVPPRDGAASPDWLTRLAAWADLHPPRHHRLGSYLLWR